MIKIKSHKYRLYPNKTQRDLMSKTFGCCRFVYNNHVASFNSYDKETNTKPIYSTPKELKETQEFLSEVSQGALQQKLMDFKKSTKNFFRQSRKGTGTPKFKSKYNKQSFRLPNQKCSVVDNKVKLEKLGLVKYSKDRELPLGHRILSMTISLETNGQYFVSINFEYEQTIKTKENKQNVGGDLGISKLITLSDGLQFNNPTIFSKNQAKLKTAQQHLSRKKKGSYRRKRQVIKVSKIHKDISNSREWYLHNVSKYIVDNYNEIGLEDLDVSSMFKENKSLNRNLSDSSMSKLKKYITYKQKMYYDKEIVLYPRFEPSTKLCSSCGHIQKMNLNDRVFNCNECESSLNRDLNASINIKNKTVGVNAVYNQTLSDNKTLHPLVGYEQIALKRSHNKL